MEIWVLIVWFGVGQSQTFSVDHFATKQECEAVSSVIDEEVDSTFGTFKCIKAEVK